MRLCLCPPLPAEPCPSLDNPFLVSLEPFQGPYPTSPPETPLAASLVSECPSPHTWFSDKQESALTQPGLCSFLLLTSPQVPGLLPQGRYWDQGKEAGLFCPFPGTLLLPDWAGPLILRKPTSLHLDLRHHVLKGNFIYSAMPYHF